MSFRQINLDVFRGNPLPHVFFQPRIEPWYAWHRAFDQMPEAYRHLSLMDLFDQLQVSIRYMHYYTDLPDPLVQDFAPEVNIRRRFSEREGTVIYETPHGDLTEKVRRTQDETWRTVEFAIKQPADFKKLRWLYQYRIVRFSAENFAAGNQTIGERGEPQFWVARSPYQALALDWMRYQDFVYALMDDPREIEETLRVIDDSYDRLYQEILAYGQVKIVNFGENLHGHLLSPRFFENYLLPFYDKRSNQLRQAGIFTHVHLDGAVKPLLRYLKDLPFDGIEALTPLPQGDVMLEEIKEHIGSKILLDGIPAVLFMPTFSREELMQTVERVVELFHPRLILGVSDEIPEGADLEAMERVRLVSEWCRSR